MKKVLFFILGSLVALLVACLFKKYDAKSFAISRVEKLKKIIDDFEEEIRIEEEKAAKA